MVLGLAELLEIKGLDLSKENKIVRHQDKRYNVQEMLEKGQLEIYQSYQTNPIFDYDFVVSTIGDESTKSVFHNVYKVIDKKKAKEVPLKGEYNFKDLIAEIMHKDGWYYRLQRLEGFEDLSEELLLSGEKLPFPGINILAGKKIKRL